MIEPRRPHPGFAAHRDALQERLLASRATPAERATALMVFAEVLRRLGRQTHDCAGTATEIGDRLGVDKVSMSKSLALLERIGAIARVKRGRNKIITVTPEAPPMSCGVRKSPMTKANTMSAPATSPGAVSGRTRRRKIVTRPAPRSAAASNR